MEQEKYLVRLTDIYEMSGAGANKLPSYWKALQSTKELFPEVVTKVGKGHGTYGSVEAALAYACWISPEIYKRILSRIAYAKNDLEQILSDFEIPEELGKGWKIYVIQNPSTGNVKVGLSKDPEKRLKTLQVGNDQKLVLLGYFEAKQGRSEEYRLHREYRDFRISGEWFSQEILPHLKSTLKLKGLVIRNPN